MKGCLLTCARRDSVTASVAQNSLPSYGPRDNAACLIMKIRVAGGFRTAADLPLAAGGSSRPPKIFRSDSVTCECGGRDTWGSVNVYSIIMKTFG